MSQIAKLDGPGGIKLARSREPIVKANELLFVHFERPDIGKAERYLLDFGLTVVAKSEGELFMRGTGSQPYIYRISIGPEARFLGLGLSVPTKEDLQKLSKASGRPVVPANTPGGGSVVHLRDPEGVAVDVLHGFVPNKPLPVRSAIPHNAPNQIVRVNDTQRPALVPPQVTKLGHLVLEALDFDVALTGFSPEEFPALTAKHTAGMSLIRPMRLV